MYEHSNSIHTLLDSLIMDPISQAPPQPLAPLQPGVRIISTHPASHSQSSTSTLKHPHSASDSDSDSPSTPSSTTKKRRRHGGRIPGAQSFTRADKKRLLAVIRIIKPRDFFNNGLPVHPSIPDSGSRWEEVAAEYNRQSDMKGRRHRDAAGLRKYWEDVVGRCLEVLRKEMKGGGEGGLGCLEGREWDLVVAYEVWGQVWGEGMERVVEREEVGKGGEEEEQVIVPAPAPLEALKPPTTSLPVFSPPTQPAQPQHTATPTPATTSRRKSRPSAALPVPPTPAPAQLPDLGVSPAALAHYITALTPSAPPPTLSPSPATNMSAFDAALELYKRQIHTLEEDLKAVRGELKEAREKVDALRDENYNLKMQNVVLKFQGQQGGGAGRQMGVGGGGGQGQQQQQAGLVGGHMGSQMGGGM